MQRCCARLLCACCTRLLYGTRVGGPPGIRGTRWNTFGGSLCALAPRPPTPTGSQGTSTDAHEPLITRTGQRPDEGEASARREEVTTGILGAAAPMQLAALPLLARRGKTQMTGAEPPG